MKITEVRAKTCRVDTELFNGRGTRVQSAVTLLAAITDVFRNGKPVIGYSFSATGFPPPTAQLQERFIPRLLATSPEDLIIDPSAFDPAAVLKALVRGEKVGGDAERATAVGTLEIAIWDIVSKLAGRPAYQLIADTYRNGAIDPRIECYVGGGWYSPTKTVKDLGDEVRSYLDMGYRTIKIKVGGMPFGPDIDRVDEALRIVGDPSRLAVDANSGIGPDRRPAYAQALKDYNLRWFEEPTHPNDYAGNRHFIADYGNAVATGENQFSLEEIRNLVLYGGMRPNTDILQWDIAHCYGIEQAAKIVDMVATFGWSPKSVVPHGGNQISLNASVAFGFGACEAYPNAFGAFSGYSDDLVVEDGFIKVGEWEGFGFETQEDLFAEMQKLVPEYIS